MPGLRQRLRGSDCRIAHTVPSGFQVASVSMLKTRIRRSRNLKIIPPMGSFQGPEFTQLRVWLLPEFYRLLSVNVKDVDLPLGTGAIVDPQEYPVTRNIIRDVAGNVCRPVRNASLEDAEKRVRSKD
jgi:hypothetical protein